MHCLKLFSYIRMGDQDIYQSAAAILQALREFRKERCVYQTRPRNLTDCATTKHTAKATAVGMRKERNVHLALPDSL